MLAEVRGWSIYCHTRPGPNIDVDVDDVFLCLIRAIISTSRPGNTILSITNLITHLLSMKVSVSCSRARSGTQLCTSAEYQLIIASTVAMGFYLVIVPKLCLSDDIISVPSTSNISMLLSFFVTLNLKSIHIY